MPVPEPVKPGTDYRIGAHYFPGWKQGDHWGWSKIVPFPERKPLLGWYDEDNPEVTDWEVKWALEHGIDFFVYCWYRDKERMKEPMTVAGQRYGHAIHDGLFRSRYGDRFQFAIMWECHNAGVAEDETDLFGNLLPYWVDTYFARPNYLRFDGKPVLFVYSYYALDRMAAPLGGESNLAWIFDRLKTEAIRRGLPGLVLPFEYREAHADGLRRIRRAGADMAFAYCWHTPQRRPTADEAIAHQLASLKAWRDAAVLPFMATASVGWDPFPWQQPGNPNAPWLHPDTMTRWKLSPADWARLLREIKTFMDAEPVESPARRLLLLDNWNEWGEGHYIAPQVTDGFGYLQAVREVFTGRDNWPDYRLPVDLGLGPYDTGYASATAKSVVVASDSKASRPLVGAIRWDAWTGGEVTRQVEQTLGPKKYHARLPWFAEVLREDAVRIHGGRQDVMDREIGFAADAGLDYWAFLLYPEISSMGESLRLYLDSRSRRRIDFCLILHNAFGVDDVQWPRERERAVSLLHEPGYRTVLGGRPLVYSFEPKHRGAFPAERFDEFRRAARDSGVDPYCVFMGWNPEADFRTAAPLGFDAVSAYACGSDDATFPQLCQRVETNYWQRAAAASVPYVPLVTTGWDKNPRKEHPVSWEKDHGYHRQAVFPATATPAEIADHLDRGLAFVQQHPEICPADTLIVYSWNEHDEGGWLCPTWAPDGRPNAERLDAIRKVLRR